MRNAPIVQIIEQMGTRERTRFRDYLASPYFRVRADVQAFYDLILSHLQGQMKDFTPDAVQQRLRPENAPDNYISLLKTRLRDHWEAFSAQEDLRNDKAAYNLRKLAAMQARGESKSFKKLYRATQNLLKSEDLHSYDQYRKWFELSYLQVLYATDQTSRNEPFPLEDSFDMLERFWRSTWLKLKVAHRNLGEIIAKPGNAGPNNGTNRTNGTNLMVQAYEIALKLLETQEEEEYWKLCTLLENHSLSFSSSEVIDLYGIAVNYAVSRAASGNDDFWKETIRMYRRRMDVMLDLQDGKINALDFKNLITLLARDYTREARAEFERYHQKLIRDFRGLAVKYARGILDFYEGKYAVARDHFRKVAAISQQYGKDPYYRFDTRIYLLMIAYELENNDEFESHTRFKEMLKRERKQIKRGKSGGISEPMLANYENFYHLSARLYRLRLSPNAHPDRLKALRAEVMQINGIICRGWLITKIDKLLDIQKP